MTISYSTTSDSSGFLQLLLKWRGSLWNLVWRKLAVFCILYAIVALINNLALTEYQKSVFDTLSGYMSDGLDRMPILFLLGFYVSNVFGRWWNQFNCIPTPGRLAMLLSTTIRGNSDERRILRRTIVRWVNLSCALTWRTFTPRILKRFPTNEHLVKAGLFLPDEVENYESTDVSFLKTYLPLYWSATLLANCCERELLNDKQLSWLVDELTHIRRDLDSQLNYDWVSIPLVYTQVATFATYGYFALGLIGRQWTARDEKRYGHLLYLPLHTIIEFIFYVGWLSVAEELINPFGDDDEDFDMNFILDRNVGVAFDAVDNLHQVCGTVAKDMYWDKPPKIPHTVASAKIRDVGMPSHLQRVQIEDQLQLIIDSDNTSFYQELHGKKHLGRKVMSRRHSNASHVSPNIQPLVEEKTNEPEESEAHSNIDSNGLLCKDKHTTV